jgi:aryl-alcohol dehydrogenase-like predicted oxidoreductase
VCGYGAVESDRCLLPLACCKYRGGVQTRKIPRTDIDISVMSIGGWLTFGGSLEDATAMRILSLAVERGATFIDLADVYAEGAAESLVGEFLRQQGSRNLIVSSKVYWPMGQDPKDSGLSRRHIHASIDRTLSRLGREYVDLYFCHREDRSVALSETVQAMGDLVAAGKIRAWGTSCWRASALVKAHDLAGELGVAPPVVEQPPYNLLERSIERDVVPACQNLDMGLVVWSPLAGGALTGKYLDGRPAGSRGATSKWVDDYLTDDRHRAMHKYVTYCKDRNLTPGAVALAWAMAQPAITSVITGATSEAQLEENLGSAELKLDADICSSLDRIFRRSRTARLKSLLRRLF